MQIGGGHWEVIRNAVVVAQGARVRQCSALPQIDSRPRRQIDYGNTDASLYNPVTCR